jgi:hypothetical protein
VNDSVVRSRERRSGVLGAVTVLVVTLLAGVCAFAVLDRTVERHSSTAAVLFTTARLSGAVEGSRDVQDRIDDWSALVPGDAVAERARQLGAKASDPGTVLVGRVPPGTETVEVTATSPDADGAAVAATTAARALVDVVAAAGRDPATGRSAVSGAVIRTGGPVVDNGLWIAGLGGAGAGLVVLAGGIAVSSAARRWSRRTPGGAGRRAPGGSW